MRGPSPFAGRRMGKMARSNRRVNFPELNEIESELTRITQRGRYHRALRSTIGTLVVVAAIAVLIATLFLPVLRVTGTSMEPNLHAGEIIVGVKTSRFEIGQVCSFYFNNKLLLKRVIATQGDWVEIDEDGNVMAFEILGTVEYEGVEYAAFLPTDVESSPIHIFEVIEELDSDYDTYAGIGDQELVDKIYKNFMEEYKDIYNFTD